MVTQISKKEKAGNIFKLLIIVVTIAIVSYAWYYRGDSAEISDLTMKARAVNQIDFSLDGGKTWCNEASLNLDDFFMFNNEITGNGIDFFVPSYKHEDGSPIAFKRARVNHDYLEFNVMFKTNSMGTGIFLENKSYVVPTTGTTSNELIGSNVDRKSVLGDFSKDLIAGSVRMAFIEDKKVNGKFVPDDETKLVWAPNPNYCMSYNNGIYSADINSNLQQQYNYLNTSLNEERVDNIRDNITASYENQDADGNPMLTYISEDKQIKSITVRIWVEGNDRETVDALKGGMFHMFISFMGINKELNNNLPNVQAVGNTIDGYTNGMEYSIDYGLTWVKYNDNNDPTFTTGDVVYVRYSESTLVFSSDYVTLNY